MSAQSTVLLVGAGAREHALAERLLESPTVRRVLVTPGNPGTAGASPALQAQGKVLAQAAGDPLSLAHQLRPELTVIGPEAPLAAGLVDQLSAAGHLTYGPTQAAAQLESSKRFMKEFALECGIRTARYVAITALEQVDAAVSSFAGPPVVKADGLCAGKGVTVTQSHDEARQVAREMLRGDQFGDAATTLVLEERLEGYEVSLHAICDGERGFMLPFAQDHKRIGNADTGPNTGGMGAYAPTPQINAALSERIRTEVLEPALRGMVKRGIPFRGTLFGGLMVSPSGEPVLLEFNTRFGDPETQVLMPLIEGDLAEALSGAARGALDLSSLRVKRAASICVVLAAAGYPGTPRKGDVISGIEAATNLPGVRVYHAGTRLNAGRLETDGGRVLSVTASAATLQEAHHWAYEATSKISFAGMQRRDDIGAQALPRAGMP